MSIEQYENVIELLKSKGAKFEELYAGILQKIQDSSKGGDVSVEIQGEFPSDGSFENKSTDSKMVLTRIIITEGKKQTLLIVKNVTADEIKKCGNVLNWIAKIKVKEKGLIFTRKTEYKYFLSKIEENFVLTSIEDNSRSIGEYILDEEYLDQKEVDSIVEDTFKYKNRNWHPV